MQDLTPDFSTAAQNQYTNIGTILSNLGIATANSRDHETHFHVYLRPPKVLAIGGTTHQLEADALPLSTQSGAGSLPLAFISNAAQIMLGQLQAPVQPEEEFMFTIDIPYVPVHDVQTVVSALAATEQSPAALQQRLEETLASTAGRKSVTVENCQDVSSLSPNGSFNSIPVLQGVLKSLGYSTKQIESGKVPTAVREAIKVTVIESPRHGTVTRFATPTNAYFWQYVPEAGYRGNDRVTFLVEVEGRRFKLITNLLVERVVDEFANPPDCEKLFSPRKVTNGIASDSSTSAPILSYGGWLAVPISYSIVPKFGNLLNTALGQATGKGASAAITLV